MSSAGKKELFSTIEQQREKISKYESKITDLVRAYKSLAKEKEALEASLVALSEGSKSDTENVKDSSESREKTKKPDPENAESEAADKEVCEGNLTEIKSLRSKVATLTSTLQTLTEEKSKLEASTKGERKRILDDKKQIEQELRNGSEEWSKQKKEYESKLQELRNKIIVFQHDREKEATNGIMMLREVESRLSKERFEKERLEKTLDETQEQNRQFALALGTRSHEKKQQKQISDLQNELEQVRNRLKKAEDQCKEPPMLKILQDEMEQMRNQYMDAILQEQRRAESAERSVRSLSHTHEERVRALEESLTELSHSAANFDRRKQNYIETIHSLKEKIAELSEENMTLSRKTPSSSPSPFPWRNEEEEEEKEQEEENEKRDIHSLARRFVSLWELLQKRMKEKSAMKRVAVEELLADSQVIHAKCVEEYNKLEKRNQELETKSDKDKDGTLCVCGLKKENEDLRERLRSANASGHMTQRMHGHQVEALTQELKTLRAEHHDQLKQTEQDHKGTLAHLEQQLSEHCQRSLMTLQDRDEEIHRLTKEIHQLTKEARAQPSTVAAALLTQINTGGTDGPLLHHLEDLARKELEVSKLRKEKIQLEKSMRDIQMARIEKQQALQDTIDDLTEEVERLNRNTSREGENLEYLKNVVLQYMTSAELESRRVILTAIAAVLKFTPKETESVRKCLSLWWWQAPVRSKATQGPQRVARSPSVSVLEESHYGGVGGSASHLGRESGGVGGSSYLGRGSRSRVLSDRD